MIRRLAVAAALALVLASPLAAQGARGAASIDYAELRNETARRLAEYIRIDTSNYGDGSGPGERVAAEYVAGLLADVGFG